MTKKGSSSKELLGPKKYRMLEPTNDIEQAMVDELQRDQTFINAQTFREQIGLACQHFRQEKYQISYRRIGEMWFVNKGIVKDQETKYKNGVLSDGRPPCLKEEELHELFNYINTHVDESCLTYDEINEFVYVALHKEINKETLRHIINRNFSDHFKSVIGIPMDSKRLEADPVDIDRYFKDLEEIIKDVHPYFVYNLDEVGIQDFVDSQQHFVLVRRNYDKATIKYPVERTGKRITALFCITTNSDWIEPLVITNRATVDSEIHSIISPDKYLLCKQSRGFLTTSNLKKWFEQVFLPHLKLKRQKYNYNGHVLLLMDNFISHQQITELINFEDFGIIVHFIVAHASDQLQALDLNIFGNSKRQNGSIKGEKELTTHTNRICRLIDSLWKAASPKNVTAAFRSAGIYTSCQIINSTPLLCIGVRRGAARAVRHYDKSVLERIVESNLELSDAQKLATNKLTIKEIHDKSFRLKII